MLVSGLLLLLHYVYVEAYEQMIYQETQSPLKYRLHLNQDRVMLPNTLSQAVDVMLIHHGNMDHHKYFPLCNIKQKSVITEVQELTVVNQNKGIENDFDPAKNMTLRQLVSMSQIHDGILAVTQDMMVYMLKFNYSQIHNADDLQDLLDENPKSTQFAKLIWKGDFMKIAPNSVKQEFPQLVFAEQQNLAMLVYSDTALMFSVADMESNHQQLKVTPVLKWKPRRYRGWTKVFSHVIFSAVGHEGLDIYLINDGQIEFFQEINGKTLFDQEIDSSPSLFINDIAFTQNGESIIVYILEESRGIVIFEVTKYLTIKLLMTDIGEKNGAQSLDTYDGKSVFVVYKLIGHYTVNEYMINLLSKEWELIQTHYSRSKIVDVRVNEDFAVLQGSNYHRIVFYGIRSEFLHFQNSQKLTFEHVGLREFDFFKTHLTHQKDELLEIQQYIHTKNSSYQIDDFIFGITKYKIFLMKYKITNPHVVCYTEDGILLNLMIKESIVNSQFQYTVYFNTTTCSKIPTPNLNSICHNSRDFTVDVVSTFLYQDKIIFVAMFLGMIFLLLIAICK